MGQQKQKKKSEKIHKIGITSDTLSSRGGLSFFSKYLENTQILSFLQTLFGFIRKTKKGQEIDVIFKQLICYLMDGTSRHLTYFDQLKEDEGYAASLELPKDEMLSSHSVKRFFKAFSMVRVWGFRCVLRHLFLWRLRLEQPQVIYLGIDSMVMDNDEAAKRDGVQPTYKKKKGFHPLQMTWKCFIVDALFRGGKKHCNHGVAVERMVRKMVQYIRQNYREDIAIVILLDSGFCDEKLFKVFEALEIGYICGGKIYNDLVEFAGMIEDGIWDKYTKDKQEWNYFDFNDKRESWAKDRRAILCRFNPLDPQQVFDAFRPLTILYTNIGLGEAIDEQLRACGHGDLLQSEMILKTAHGRGKDELVHRAFKEFAFEELPFQRFAPNAAYYYVLLTAHFLYECFKEDACEGVVPVVAYANTLRRKLIDLAAKIVRTSGLVWIKFTETAWTSLNLNSLWERCQSPPQLC